MNNKSYQLVISTVEVISVPEAPLVALNVADLAPLELEVGLPHQRAVAEDPEAGLAGHDVLRLHVGRVDSFGMTFKLIETKWTGSLPLD